MKRIVFTKFCVGSLDIHIKECNNYIKSKQFEISKKNIQKNVAYLNEH